VVGDAQGHAAPGGDDVGVLVAVIGGREGDGLPVRGEPGEGLLSGRGGQALGEAPLLGHHPHVARVAEGDLGGGNVGLPDELGVQVGVGRRSGRQDHGQGQPGTWVHRYSLQMGFLKGIPMQAR